MHHGGDGGVGIASGLPWPTVGIVAVAVLVGLIVWLVAMEWQRATGRDRSDAEEVEANLEGQILAMLHQAGGSLLQTEISVNLDVPTEAVARTLRDLQDSGRVTRSWQAGEYTYRVTHRHAQTDAI